MPPDTSPTFFDYFKVIAENFTIWPVLAVFILIWLARHPEFLDRLSRLKLGGLELEMEKLQREVKDSRDEIAILENDLTLQQKMFSEVLTDFDVHAPVGELAKTREALKVQARSLDDTSIIKHSLRPDADAAEIYAAAVALRERPMVEFFGDAIDCLHRLAESADLGGIRLHFVWTLTSAVHKILLADLKHAKVSQISHADLRRARDVLNILKQNPRVQQDRVDDPTQGVRGPLGHALNWIEKGLSRK